MKVNVRKVVVSFMLLMVSVVIFAQGDSDPEVKLKWWQITILALTGTYELFVRLIPTIKDWTILGNVFKFLSYLSDMINRGELKK